MLAAACACSVLAKEGVAVCSGAEAKVSRVSFSVCIASRVRKPQAAHLLQKRQEYGRQRRATALFKGWKNHLQTKKRATRQV